MERGPQPCVRGGGAAKQAIITMQEDGFQTRCPCFLHCQRCTQLIPDGMLDDQWFHGAQEGRQPLPGFVHLDAAGTQHLQWGEGSRRCNAIRLGQKSPLVSGLPALCSCTALGKISPE